VVGSDVVKARTAAVFAQGLQTRGPLELDLGDRIGSLWQKESVRASAKALTSRISSLLMPLCSKASSGMCTPTMTSR